MAVDIFLKLNYAGDGKLGESKDKDHAGEIDVLAWQWGASRSGSATGSGRERGRTDFNDLAITKYIDSASNDLLNMVATGRMAKKAILTVRKAGDRPTDHLVIEFSDVIVSSISTGGSGGEDRLTENVTFNYRAVFYRYFEQDEDGSTTKPQKFEFDLEKGE